MGYADLAGIAAAVDAYLAIYPAVIIWNLHMGIKKKLGLSFALGLGTWYVSPLHYMSLLCINSPAPAPWPSSNAPASRHYTT